MIIKIRDPNTVLFKLNLLSLSLQIEYEIDEIQLNYLQLLSNHAQQTFTFRCKNSVAWYDESARSFKKAVKFEGVSGHEFSSKSKSKKAMIKVPYDGCKVISISTDTPGLK